MVQFTYLSLLLATIQLTLPSLTQVCLPAGINAPCKFPKQKKNIQPRKCKNISDVTKCTFKKFEAVNSCGLSCKTVSGPKCCTDKCLYVSEDKGCRSYLCRDCVDPNCQYIKVHRRNEGNVPQAHSEAVFSCFYANGIDLKYYPDAKSWIDALEHCCNEGSTLVEITSQEIQDAVNSLLKINLPGGMPGGVWIGLERSIFGCVVPRMWISWSKAETLQWDECFPINRRNNLCGKIIWVEQEFKWLDASCHDKLPFICQGSA